MANVVVTGGSGFIGSHVVDALVEAGHEVTVLDQRPVGFRGDVACRQVDLMDFNAVVEGTRGADHIFHLAAVSNVNVAFQEPVHTTGLNVLGTNHVLEAARRNGASRVYLASTVWVYNGAAGNGAADETATFHANGAGHIYTSSKLAAEMLCYNYQHLYKVPVTILRYGIPYGPRMREELLIPILLKKALNGEPLTVAGDGGQFRKFLYISDMARGHVLAMHDNAAGQTYNLEGTRKVTILEVAEGIRRLVGDHVRIDFVPERPGDFAGKEILAQKALNDLGWKAEVDFEDGLAVTVEWFRKAWRV
jgi:UDP-glucose 4-epimerase